MIKYFAFSFSTADGWVDGGWYCCTSSNLCGADEGDCDVDSECAGSLICGTNNCPSGFYYSGFDCCKRNPIGKYQLFLIYFTERGFDSLAYGPDSVQPGAWTVGVLWDPKIVAIAIYLYISIHISCS